MKKIVVIPILLLAIFGSVNAQNRVPARRGWAVEVQPNGDTIWVELRGDEAWHGYYTQDGKQVIKDEKSGWWYYAKESCCTYTDMRGNKRHKMVKSRTKVQPSASQTSYFEVPMVQPVAARRVPGDTRNMAYSLPNEDSNVGIRRIAMATQAIGTKDLMPRALVIMVQFSDWSFEAGTTKAFVDTLFNGHNYNKLMTSDWLSYSSVAQYLNDQSGSQYRPQFDIVGPVRVSEKYTQFPGSAYGATLLSKVLPLVKDSVDFSQYDANNDGKVDMVFMYYAGYGQNDANYIKDPAVTSPSSLIWPHMSTYSGTLKYNGKGFAKYECCNELDGYISYNETDYGVSGRVHAGIGTFCHEFGHGLGLPDIYRTDPNTGDWRMGPYDLMDYGNYGADGYQPPCFTAYERWFFGWLTPTPINTAATLTLKPISTSNQAYLLNASGTIPDDPNTSGVYYLLENRQPSGWDTYLPGKGMIVTRIQYNSNNWVRNTVNCTTTQTNWGISPILPDGSHAITDKNYNIATWPGTSTNELTIVDNFKITEITQLSNGDITFKVNGSETPTGVTASTPSSRGETRKVVREGHVVIVREGKEYDLLGRTRVY